MNNIKKMVKNIYAFIFLIVIISSFILIYIINKIAMPIISDYAVIETKKVGIEVLRNTGIKEVNNKLKNKDFLVTTYNKNNEIETIDFNTKLINETMIEIAKNVRKRLKETEQGKNLPDEMYDNISSKKLKNGIIYEIPLGLVFNNAFLMNVGPKIPVKIKYSGNVGLDIKSRVKPYGINSTLLEIYVYIEVTQKAILPFKTRNIKLTSEVPIVMKLVKGSVPNYLLGTKNSYSLQLD